MVSPFTLPPMGFGPGSQPAPEDALDYMAMPSGMRTYAPHLPEVADPAAVQPAIDMLLALADLCDRAATGGAGGEFDMAPLPAPARALMAETLGHGEVQMKLRGLPAIAVQESVFAGVWALKGEAVDRVEVGAVPALSRARAHVPHRPAIGVLAQKGPGLANAPSILAEILGKSQAFRAGDLPHVVNLSLLPHTEPDLLWLDEALGEGAVTVLSRGYGNCRITAAAQAHVWRVQFYNSSDALILDTWEVGGMPEVALAAPEDLADSAARIREVVRAIR